MRKLRNRYREALWGAEPERGVDSAVCRPVKLRRVPARRVRAPRTWVRRMDGVWALTGLVSLSLMCCSVLNSGSSGTARILLPDLPVEWNTAEVEWIAILTVGETVYHLEDASPGDYVYVSLPAEYPVAIQGAFGVKDGSGDGPPIFETVPAGAAVPTTDAKDHVALSYADGPAISIFAQAVRLGAIPSTINLERLLVEVAARAGEKGWSIDIDGAAGALVTGTMSAAKLTPRQEVSERVVIGGEKWLPHDVLRRSSMKADDEGGLVLEGLAPGVHRFLSHEGDAIVSVFAAACGGVRVVTDPHIRDED